MSQIVSAVEPTAADDAHRASPVAWYTTFVLMLVYALSFIDRKLPFILLEDIRHDLKLSDTELGLLTGLAFTAVYAVSAIPLSRLADRRSRKTIIVIAIAVWSAMTAMGGFALNFVQLAVARAGVAIGEAACTPAAHSMLGDLFRPHQRAKALALYMLGAPLGILLGMSLGGWVGQMSSWRLAMIAVGAPGIALSLLVLFGVREPARTATAEENSDMSSFAAIGMMLRSPVLRHILISGAVATAASGASNAFAPAYMIRTFHLSTAETGVLFGVVSGTAGMIGAVVGGVAGDYLRRTSRARAILMVALLFLVSGPLLIVGFLADSLYLFLALQFVALLFAMVYAGPCFATVQDLVGARQRAVATAVYMFALNGVGVSLGPLIAGALSDMLRSEFGDASLSIGLAVLACGKIWGGLHLLVAARRLREMDARTALAEQTP